MIGLLTYLPTTAYFPQFFFLLAFAYALFRERARIQKDFSDFLFERKHPISTNLAIIGSIIFLSSLNRIIHWKAASQWGEMFPYFFLLIPAYILAIYFKERDAKTLAIFVVLESVVVILEWMSGVSTFDTRLHGFRDFGDTDLAYFTRPLGWSESSSVMATKLLITWFLIDFFDFRSRWWWLAKGLMLAAVILTFNRSVLLALGIYLVISQSIAFLKLKYSFENAILGFVGIVVGSIGAIGVGILKWREIIGQLTRNKGTVELTGREYIWADFIDFIFANPLYGNNSIKLWLDEYHAHNAYIELIATNGIIIACIYFLLIARNIHSKNWVFVVPILIFGITQYAFFWGISLFDILFWVILFGGKKIIPDPVLPVGQFPEVQPLKYSEEKRPLSNS